MSRSLCSATALCLTLIVAGLVATPVALGDADPPSDTLPGRDYYVPYAPPVDAAVESKLGSLLDTARAGNHAFKVAVIGTPADLGSLTVLFDKPQRYATFLNNEIRPFVADASLLTVMPAGFGLEGPDATPPALKALQSVKIPSGADATQLTDAAVQGVQAVAAANHHPLGKVEPGGSTGSSSWRWLVFGLSLAAAAGAALIALAARERRRRLSESNPPSDED